MNININSQRIKSIQFYKDDLLTRLFKDDTDLGNRAPNSSEYNAVSFLDTNSDGKLDTSDNSTKVNTFGTTIDTIYNSVFNTNGSLKLDANGNLSSTYLNNDGSLKSGSIDINKDGSKDAIDDQILQTTMNIAHKVQQDLQTNLTNAIKSGTVPILGTKFNIADMNLLQEATKNNKVNYVYTEAWYRENGHKSTVLFSSKSDFADFFNGLFDRDFNVNQVKEVLLMADKLADKLPATPTAAQKADCVKRLELYSTIMKDYKASAKDLLSFDTFASAANIPISSTVTTSQIRAYDPALSNIYGSSGNGPKMNDLLSVVAGDTTDPNSSTKQRYLLSAISEGKLPISGKTLNLNTLSSGTNFTDAYSNLTKLFDAVGDNVKTTKLHLDRMASESKYTSLFGRMGTAGSPAEPWLINQLRTKVTSGDCNLGQVEKVMELADNLAKNVDPGVSDADFQKKIGLYLKVFLDDDSSVNVRDIVTFDKFLNKIPSGVPGVAALKSGLDLIDSSKLTNYVPGSGQILFDINNTNSAIASNAQKMQDLWDVFIGDETDPNSSTKQRYLLSAISKGKLPISGKTLTANGATLNFGTDYTNLDKLFAAVDDADLMRKLKIDSWVDNLPAAKLSYHNKEDVKRVFNSSFDASSYRVISTFQNLFESGIYDLSSLEYFKDLLENQKKTEADIRAMIKLNILSPEDLNAYSNANTTNVKLDANGKVDKDAQVNYWVSTGFSLNGTPLKIDNVAADKNIFKDFLSNDVSNAVDSVLKTGTYYVSIYNNLGSGGLALGSSTKTQAIGTFRDVHNNGAEPRELMDLLEYSLAESLTYANISTALTFTTGTLGGNKSLLTYLTDPMHSSNKIGFNIDPQFARRHELLKEVIQTGDFPTIPGFTLTGTTPFDKLKNLLNGVNASGSIGSI